MHKLKGFTLIELLIVIAVIAILVGITVPRFLGMRDEANMAVAAGETNALKAAVEAYYIHEDDYQYDGQEHHYCVIQRAGHPSVANSPSSVRCN